MYMKDKYLSSWQTFFTGRDIFDYSRLAFRQIWYYYALYTIIWMFRNN